MENRTDRNTVTTKMLILYTYLFTDIVLCANFVQKLELE